MRPKHKIIVKDFGRKRKDEICVFIGEISSCPLDWVKRGRLYFHNKPTVLFSQVKKMLKLAENNEAELILLPELSVSKDNIPYLRTWSKRTKTIIIAGSHYHWRKDAYVNRSPVIINGKVFYTEKLYPSPGETSIVRGEKNKAKSGKWVIVFKNTKIGKFSVLICSDYLLPGLRNEIIDAHNLDILCVPAFQNKAVMHYERMKLDCDEAGNGIYIAYANMLCKGKTGKDDPGAGGSALFGLIHDEHRQECVDRNWTDKEMRNMICRLLDNQDFMVLKINLKSKRPFISRRVGEESNVHVIRVGTRRPEFSAPSMKELKSTATIAQRRKVLDRAQVAEENIDIFIKENSTVANIDLKVGKVIGRTIIASPNFIKNYVMRLTYMKLTTVGMVETQLTKHRLAIIKFLVAWFKTDVGKKLVFLPEGMCLSFLCYFLVIRREGTEGLTKLMDLGRINTQTSMPVLIQSLVNAYEIALKS